MILFVYSWLETIQTDQLMLINQALVFDPHSKVVIFDCKYLVQNYSFNSSMFHFSIYTCGGKLKEA